LPGSAAEARGGFDICPQAGRRGAAWGGKTGELLNSAIWVGGMIIPPWPQAAGSHGRRRSRI